MKRATWCTDLLPTVMRSSFDTTKFVTFKDILNRRPGSLQFGIFFFLESKLYAGLQDCQCQLMDRMWMYASQELRGGTGIPHGDELSRLAPEIDGEFKVDREWVWVDLDAGGRGTSGARTVRREGASLKMSPPCFSFFKMEILLGTILFLIKLRWGSSLVYIFYPTKDLLRVKIFWQCVQHDHVILSLC